LATAHQKWIEITAMGEGLEDHLSSDAGRIAESNGQAGQALGSSSFHHYIRHGFKLAKQLAKHTMAAAIRAAADGVIANHTLQFALPIGVGVLIKQHDRSITKPFHWVAVHQADGFANG
jgi:hypothetical protein